MKGITMVHVWRYLVGLAATAVAAAIMVVAYLTLVDCGTSNLLLVAALLALIAASLAWIIVMAHRGAALPMFSPKGMLLLIAVIVPGLNLVVPYFIGKQLLRRRFPDGAAASRG